MGACMPTDSEPQAGAASAGVPDELALINVVGDDNCIFNAMAVMIQQAYFILNDPNPLVAKDTIDIFNAPLSSDFLNELEHVLSVIETEQALLLSAMQEAIKAGEHALQEDAYDSIKIHGEYRVNEAFYNTRYTILHNAFANYLLRHEGAFSSAAAEKNPFERFQHLFNSKLSAFSLRRRQELMAIALRRLAMKPWRLQPGETSLTNAQQALIWSAQQDYAQDGAEQKFPSWVELITNMQELEHEAFQFKDPVISALKECIDSSLFQPLLKQASDAVPIKTALIEGCKQLIFNALIAQTSLTTDVLTRLDWDALGIAAYENNRNLNEANEPTGNLKDYSWDEWAPIWQCATESMKAYLLTAENITAISHFQQNMAQQAEAQLSFYSVVYQHYLANGVWPDEIIYVPAFAGFCFPLYGRNMHIAREIMSEEGVAAIKAFNGFWGSLHNPNQSHFNVVVPRSMIERYAPAMGAHFSEKLAGREQITVGEVAIDVELAPLPIYRDGGLPGLDDGSSPLYFDDLVPGNDFQARMAEITKRSPQTAPAAFNFDDTPAAPQTVRSANDNDSSGAIVSLYESASDAKAEKPSFLSRYKKALAGLSLLTLLSGAGAGFAFGYMGFSIIGGAGLIAGGATLGVGFAVAAGVILLALAVTFIIQARADKPEPKGVTSPLLTSDGASPNLPVHPQPAQFSGMNNGADFKMNGEMNGPDATDLPPRKISAPGSRQKRCL